MGVDQICNVSQDVKSPITAHHFLSTLSMANVPSVETCGCISFVCLFVFLPLGSVQAFKRLGEVLKHSRALPGASLSKYLNMASLWESDPERKACVLFSLVKGRLLTHCSLSRNRNVSRISKNDN